ncbi:MAG TPA: hypothetical protein VEA69_03015 [Tepidisphaeraceae bacterium]|nr:hypothetical protein [Tepidisphaeraceae bacterium]
MKEEVAELAGREPFIPFAIVMNSGERYPVTEADVVVVREPLLHIVRSRPARQDVLRLTEISSLEVSDSY